MHSSKTQLPPPYAAQHTHTLIRDTIIPSPITVRRQPSRGRISPSQLPRTLNKRQEFLIFIKILFLLFTEGNDDMRRMRAKRIIAKCTRRNRLGHPEYANLQHAVESRLHYMLGEAYWMQAKDYLDNYCRRRGFCQP